MNKVRVMIVDDSTVIRRLLTEALTADPEIDVVGTASNGKLALTKIPQLRPDVITLDVEMPEMSGLETLPHLRRQHPSLPVIMFSTLTERGGEATLQALALGATDYVAKPANVGSVTQAIQSVREQLIPKIKILGRVRSRVTGEALLPHPNEGALLPTRRPIVGTAPHVTPSRHTTPARPETPVPAAGGATPVRTAAPRPRRGAFEVLCIGTSTGGPNALGEVFAKLPSGLPVPIVIVQHMPPLFTKCLADRLSALGQVPVHEAEDGELLRPGEAWLAPGDRHMEVRMTASGVGIRLHEGPLENFCRPAVDVLFRSVARTYRGGILACVLTGMGQDGAKGCESIRASGGYVMAQDEATSVVWGMPGVVAKQGLADEILPLSRVAPQILLHLQAGRSLATTGAMG